MYIFEPGCRTSGGMTGICMWDPTGACIFVGNYKKVLEQLSAGMWAYIHALMHVHMLTMVWEQRRGDIKTHAEPDRCELVYMQICKGSAADIESQVNMHSFTDVCMHFDKGV